MALNADDDFVFLICKNPNPTESDITHDEILISTTEIDGWDLHTILSYQTVKVRATRNRLIEQSSYFRGLLGGSFSESCLDCIIIQWNLEAFMNVLKFIYSSSLDVTSDNFLPLFEAALFFGLETLLFKCRSWFSEVTSSKGIWSLQIQLDDLIHIWNFSILHANDFIQELCTSYLARNFMWAMSHNSFCDVPYNLLLSCIKHPHLTVYSEKHLSDALIVWLDANTKRTKCLSSAEDDHRDILKQIRISLLPLWFAAGKRKCCYFSKLADESIDAILNLMKPLSTSSMNALGDDYLYHLRIRLTEYTKKVDLSGCPQVTSAILLLCVLPSENMDLMLRKSIKQSLISLERLDGDHCPFSRGLLPILSFEAVQEVDISKCPMLHLEASIECFCKSFPSLRTLKAAYLLNFKSTTLRKLVQKCPLVSDVDLTVDISPVIPSQVSIVSSSQDVMPQGSTKSFSTKDYSLDAKSFYLSGPLLSNITKLTLEGRSDVSDFNLQDISEFCASLNYLNLKGCISVTDVGISVLIYRCIKLHSIIVCDTSFGRNSILALCASIPHCGHFPAAHFEKKHLDSLAFKLQKLHMGGCNSVDEVSLSELMSHTHMLKSLCLGNTHLVDRAIYGFLGSSLEMLDVSDTMVSGAALTHIIRGNPGLKCLKARGCRNLFQQELNVEGGEFSSLYSSCKELYFELGKTCKLEEIALGWGFTCFSLEALKPAIMSLRTISVGLGGSLGEDALALLPTTCPLLESLILYFQVISDIIVINILESLRHLQVLALCYCLGDISPLSFKSSMPNLRKLRLERVTPWMTNDNLVMLTQYCANLIELSLLGCTLLSPDSQQIISHGWPGLISIHLEDCGEVTANGVASLLDCKALEDLLLRHNAQSFGTSSNVDHSGLLADFKHHLASLRLLLQWILTNAIQGPGIQRNFILDAASRMPMLRKISLDLCDVSEGDLEIPDYADRYFLSIVKIARCKSQKCSLDLQNLEARRRPVHKETLVLAWNSKNLIKTVVKERV